MTVLVKNLQKHLRKVHVAESNKVVQEANSDPENRFLENRAEERRLDGSRDFYNKVRDHGQFGSHPSYDDCNDESSPELFWLVGNRKRVYATASAL